MAQHQIYNMVDIAIDKSMLYDILNIIIRVREFIELHVIFLVHKKTCEVKQKSVS